MRYPIPLSQSWPLVLTSSGWFLVFIYGVHLYLLSGDILLAYLVITTLFTSVCSITHWFDARYGPRRNVDMFMARVGLVSYSVVAICRIRDRQLMYWGWIMWVLMVCFYKGGQILFFHNSYIKWVICHAAFHICVGMGQIIILTGELGAFFNRQ